MKLPPLSTYAPSLTSHPADVRTQGAVTQALNPAQSDSPDRVEQFIQAGFAKATALLDQITSSDKPPTLDQLTRYINALTRLATARNAAAAAPISAPKHPPIQNPPASTPRTAPASQPAPVPNRHPAASNRQPASIPPANSTSQHQTLSTLVPAKTPSDNSPFSVTAEPSVVEIPLPPTRTGPVPLRNRGTKEYTLVHLPLPPRAR